MVYDFDLENVVERNMLNNNILNNNILNNTILKSIYIKDRTTEKQPYSILSDTDGNTFTVKNGLTTIDELYDFLGNLKQDRLDTSFYIEADPQFALDTIKKIFLNVTKNIEMTWDMHEKVNIHLSYPGKPECINKLGIRMFIKTKETIKGTINIFNTSNPLAPLVLHAYRIQNHYTYSVNDGVIRERIKHDNRVENNNMPLANLIKRIALYQESNFLSPTFGIAIGAGVFINILEEITKKPELYNSLMDIVILHGEPYLQGLFPDVTSVSIPLEIVNSPNLSKYKKGPISDKY